MCNIICEERNDTNTQKQYNNGTKEMNQTAVNGNFHTKLWIKKNRLGSIYLKPNVLKQNFVSFYLHLHLQIYFYLRTDVYYARNVLPQSPNCVHRYVYIVYVWHIRCVAVHLSTYNYIVKKGWLVVSFSSSSFCGFSENVFFSPTLSVSMRNVNNNIVGISYHVCVVSYIQCGKLYEMENFYYQIFNSFALHFVPSFLILHLCIPFI